jgi:hypothetical protein
VDDPVLPEPSSVLMALTGFTTLVLSWWYRRRRRPRP